MVTGSCSISGASRSTSVSKDEQFVNEDPTHRHFIAYPFPRLLDFPRVCCSAFSLIVNPQGLRALMHRELPFRFQ
jgi:hypothetical protein